MLVDDGSSDGTPRCSSSALADSDPRVHVVFLSRNFGHQTALTAGLDHARGDAVVMLDADLQDPPELIPRCSTTGAPAATSSTRSASSATASRASSSRPRAGSTGCSTGSPRSSSQHNSGDFRLLDRRALDALLSMRERNRFLRGMTVWVGYTQAAVPYDRDARYAGETKYTLPKMLRFSLDAISSFSHRPLQLATLLGFLISTLAFIAIPVVIVLRILGSYLPGFSTITIAILLLGGIQLIAIGIIGEYVGRIYDEVKGRPLYLVRSAPELRSSDETGEPPLPPAARAARATSGSDGAGAAGRVRPAAGRVRRRPAGS